MHRYARYEVGEKVYYTSPTEPHWDGLYSISEQRYNLILKQWFYTLRGLVIPKPESQLKKSYVPSHVSYAELIAYLKDNKPHREQGKPNIKRNK